MFDMEMLGESIRHLRKVRGLTQEELAKKAGLSTMSIRRYENGERIVTEKAMARIADALDVAIYEFFPEDEKIDKERFPWWPLYPPRKLAEAEAKHYAKRRLDEAEAWKARLDKIGEDMANLNDEGQQEAVKRVKELTEIKKYQRPRRPSPLSAGIKVYGDGPAGSFSPQPQNTPQSPLPPQVREDITQPENAPEAPPEGE